MARSSRTTLHILGITACAVALVASSACTTHDAAPQSAELPSTTGDGTPHLPPIRHVFVVVLENKNFDKTFGPRSEAPYLADTLVGEGALLTHYYGIGHYSLDNYIAMISGQAPNPDTQADCGRFTDFVERGMAADGQVIGRGCVYPGHVLTIANQLEQRGLTWRAYMEDMGNDPARESATCGHAPIGQADMTEGAQKGDATHPLDQYAAKHNPFVYFHSIIDSATCQRNVVPLTRLEADLGSEASTPNYVFISPNLCHDGHDSRCGAAKRAGSRPLTVSYGTGCRSSGSRRRSRTGCSS